MVVGWGGGVWGGLWVLLTIEGGGRRFSSQFFIRWIGVGWVLLDCGGYLFTRVQGGEGGRRGWRVRGRVVRLASPYVDYIPERTRRGGWVSRRGSFLVSFCCVCVAPV